MRKSFGDLNNSDMEIVHQIGNKQVDLKPFDLDKLFEHNLKIFGDVFESLIGAVFMDSQSIDTTWKVLWHLIEPYIKVYANLETMQDHPRTKLLELWNQKSYTKIFKCNHRSDDRSGETITFIGEIQFQRSKPKMIIKEVF